MYIKCRFYVGFNCPAINGTYFYPDQHDCRFFYLCVGSVAYRLSCPSGLFFDAVTLQCCATSNNCISSSSSIATSATTLQTATVQAQITTSTTTPITLSPTTITQLPTTSSSSTTKSSSITTQPTTVPITTTTQPTTVPITTTGTLTRPTSNLKTDLLCFIYFIIIYNSKS